MNSKFKPLEGNFKSLDIDNIQENDDEKPISLLNISGDIDINKHNEEYAAEFNNTDINFWLKAYKDMYITRAYDNLCTNLQRQGQLALWVQSLGQEGIQIGLALAARKQDHFITSYREHVIAKNRGVDLLEIASQFRGVSYGSWDINDPKNGGMHPYTLVIGAQVLHGTGYAMGMLLDGVVGTGDLGVDSAVISIFGDGASSQGSVSEAMIFASSYQTPQLFVIQNNRWAISVPVTRQSRVPLSRRSQGFGIPSIRIDGNDPLISYSVAKVYLDKIRSGSGPKLIEALTYRIAPHTTSDDPSKYRSVEELEYWKQFDPINRLRNYLKKQDVSDEVFIDIDNETKDFVSNMRSRIIDLADPSSDSIFKNVYSDPHPEMIEQARLLDEYEQRLNVYISGVEDQS